MELENLTFTTGYVGSFGKTWNTPTAEELETAIVGAMEIEGKSRDEIIAALEAGNSVRWCKSPNHYYDHSYGVIGRKHNASAPEMVRCSCGHTVPRSQVMQASHGTACPDCYDRMS